MIPFTPWIKKQNPHPAYILINKRILVLILLGGVQTAKNHYHYTIYLGKMEWITCEFVPF